MFFLIQKVEDASNRAAEQVFGINQYGGRARGKAVAKATKEYMQVDEQAHNEGNNCIHFTLIPSLNG